MFHSSLGSEGQKQHEQQQQHIQTVSHLNGNIQGIPQQKQPQHPTSSPPPVVSTTVAVNGAPASVVHVAHAVQGAVPARQVVHSSGLIPRSTHDATNNSVINTSTSNRNNDSGSSDHSSGSSSVLSARGSDVQVFLTLVAQHTEKPRGTSFYADVFHLMRNMREDNSTVALLSQDCVPKLFSGMMYDLRSGDGSTITAALRVLGYFVQHPGYSQMLEAGRMFPILQGIITGPPHVQRCSLALWCVGVQDLSGAAEYALAMAVCICEQLKTETFSSSVSLKCTAFDALSKLRLQSSDGLAALTEKWALFALQGALDADSIELQQAAARLIKTVRVASVSVSKEVEQQVVAFVMDTTHTKRLASFAETKVPKRMFHVLWTIEFVFKLMGRKCGTSAVNNMLSVLSSLFWSEHVQIRIACYQTWGVFSRTISKYSAFHKHSKIVMTTMKPFSRCLKREKELEVRAEALSVWCGLLEAVSRHLFYDRGVVKLGTRNNVGRDEEGEKKKDEEEDEFFKLVLVNVVRLLLVSSHLRERELGALVVSRLLSPPGVSEDSRSGPRLDASVCVYTQLGPARGRLWVLHNLNFLFECMYAMSHAAVTDNTHSRTTQRKDGENNAVATSSVYGLQISRDVSVSTSTVPAPASSSSPSSKFISDQLAHVWDLVSFLMMELTPSNTASSPKGGQSPSSSLAAPSSASSVAHTLPLPAIDVREKTGELIFSRSSPTLLAKAGQTLSFFCLLLRRVYACRVESSLVVRLTHSFLRSFSSMLHWPADVFPEMIVPSDWKSSSLGNESTLTVLCTVGLALTSAALHHFRSEGTSQNRDDLPTIKALGLLFPDPPENELDFPSPNRFRSRPGDDATHCRVRKRSKSRKRGKQEMDETSDEDSDDVVIENESKNNTREKGANDTPRQEETIMMEVEEQQKADNKRMFSLSMRVVLRKRRITGLSVSLARSILVCLEICPHTNVAVSQYFRTPFTLLSQRIWKTICERVGEALVSLSNTAEALLEKAHEHGSSELCDAVDTLLQPPVGLDWDEFLPRLLTMYTTSWGLVAEGDPTSMATKARAVSRAPFSCNPEVVVIWKNLLQEYFSLYRKTVRLEEMQRFSSSSPSSSSNEKRRLSHFRPYRMLPRVLSEKNSSLPPQLQAIHSCFAVQVSLCGVNSLNRALSVGDNTLLGRVSASCFGLFASPGGGDGGVASVGGAVTSSSFFDAVASTLATALDYWRTMADPTFSREDSKQVLDVVHLLRPFLISLGTMVELIIGVAGSDHDLPPPMVETCVSNLMQVYAALFSDPLGALTTDLSRHDELDYIKRRIIKLWVACLSLASTSLVPRGRVGESPPLAEALVAASRIPIGDIHHGVRKFASLVVEMGNANSPVPPFIREVLEAKPRSSLVIVLPSPPKKGRPAALARIPPDAESSSDMRQGQTSAYDEEMGTTADSGSSEFRIGRPRNLSAIRRSESHEGGSTGPKGAAAVVSLSSSPLVGNQNRMLTSSEPSHSVGSIGGGVGNNLSGTEMKGSSSYVPQPGESATVPGLPMTVEIDPPSSPLTRASSGIGDPRSSATLPVTLEPLCPTLVDDDDDDDDNFDFEGEGAVDGKEKEEKKNMGGKEQEEEEEDDDDGTIDIESSDAKTVSEASNRSKRKRSSSSRSASDTAERVNVSELSNANVTAALIGDKRVQLSNYDGQVQAGHVSDRKVTSPMEIEDVQGDVTHEDGKQEGPPTGASSSLSVVIFPPLISCTDSIDAVLFQFKKSFKNLFVAQSISTIGDLASLTEEAVSRLPMPHPVMRVRQILTDYYTTASSSAIDSSRSVSHVHVSHLSTLESLVGAVSNDPSLQRSDWIALQRLALQLASHANTRLSGSD